MTTTDIITTGTTNTDETTTKTSFAKRLCDSLERASEMRAVSEDPDNDYLGDMSHMIDMLDDACDTLIRRAVYFTLQLASFDAICDVAVVALRESYLAGYREWPRNDVDVACAYADVLTSEIDKFIANDYLAYAPMSDISDTLDTIDEMVSVESSADDDAIVSLIQSILRDDHVTKLPESRKFLDAYDNASESTVTLTPETETETSGAALARRVAEAEVVDDTNERLDDLLKIGHLTVDDLIKGLPGGGDTDPINVAAALVSGGLVCDPDGHVHVDPFTPTDAVDAYPRRIVNALLDCRLSVVTTALDILSFDAATRTVQLTPDVVATILSFDEVPEEVWMPAVDAWCNDPWGDRWVRHGRRYQAVLDAYDAMYDDYNAGKRPCADIADDPDVMDDEAFENAEYDGIVLDEHLIATGGWLLVEDEFDQRFFVNTLDVYGFDDARTIADAGSVWPSATYQAIRAKHRAA